MEPLATFGPYTILRAIAANDVAVSFAARFEGQHDAEYVLALKVIQTELSADTAFTELLTEQTKLAVRLNHVNVAQTFDLGKTEGREYVVLEFVDGIPLGLIQSAVQKGVKAVTAEVATFIAAEMCAGLAYAHGRRDERGRPLDIVHTQIGPRTVLLAKSGLVKVVDFGLSRALTAHFGSERFDSEVLNFAAPEIVRGEEYDNRADVFSVGAVAYLLLTGRRVYHGARGDDLVARAERGYVPDIRDADSSTPEELAALVTRALSPDREQRFADATELRSGLAAWLRKNSPGFGRHRLKNYLQRLLPEATYGLLPDREWETLHRKHFEYLDPDSVLGEEIGDGVGVPKHKDDLESLLVNPDLPAPHKLDVSRMATGAHEMVRGDAMRRASARGASTETLTVSEAERVQAPPPGDGLDDAAEVFASRSYLDGEQTPSAVDVPTVDAPPEPEPEPEEEPRADPKELAEAVYDDTIDPDFSRQAMEEAEDRATGASPSSSGRFIAIFVALLILGGLGLGVKHVIDLRGVEPAADEGPPPVFVTSRPQGAEIVVDGEPLGLTTPAPLRALSPTASSVTVSLAGFETPPAQTVGADTARGAVNFVLEPTPHRIRIDSDPPGAEVIYEGHVAGNTPYVLGPIGVDYRQGVDLVVRLEGYLDERISVDWAPGAGESSIRRPLQPDPAYVPPEL